MKRNLLFSAAICLFLNINTTSAQTVWDGPTITFTKADKADWKLEANQDRITDNVWITRASSKSIFNIAVDTAYLNSSSPTDTEWAFGEVENKDTMTFKTFENATGKNPQGAIDKAMVLHLIKDDIYIDIKFKSYTGGNGGGGFSYERSTKKTSSVATVVANRKIELFPNPAQSTIHISGISESTNYSILNAVGAEMISGNISGNSSINIESISAGLYFLQTSDGTLMRFIKE